MASFIKIRFPDSGKEFKAELLKGQQLKATNAFLQELEKATIEGNVERWGKEIYFYVNVQLPKGATKTTMEVGEIAFWHDGPAIAIFFGKTPASKGERPEAYSPVTPIAQLQGKIDIETLDSVRDGERVAIELQKAKE